MTSQLGEAWSQQPLQRLYFVGLSAWGRRQGFGWVKEKHALVNVPPPHLLSEKKAHGTSMLPSFCVTLANNQKGPEATIPSLLPRGLLAQNEWVSYSQIQNELDHG